MPMLHPSDAYRIASSWGSYMTAGDPGACFYGFRGHGRFEVQSRGHRRQCLAYAARCIALTRTRNDTPREVRQAIVDRAELRQLKRALRCAPVDRRA